MALIAMALIVNPVSAEASALELPQGSHAPGRRAPIEQLYAAYSRLAELGWSLDDIESQPSGTTSACHRAALAPHRAAARSFPAFTARKRPVPMHSRRNR
jgi:hypothetical protein